MKYDIFKHGTGVRVYDLRSKRYGVVKEIKETSCEWIDPFIQWDGETEIESGQWTNLEVVNETDDSSKR